MEQLFIVIGFLLLSALSSWMNKKAQPQPGEAKPSRSAQGTATQHSTEAEAPPLPQEKSPEFNLEDLLKQILTGSKNINIPSKNEPDAKPLEPQPLNAPPVFTKRNTPVPARSLERKMPAPGLLPAAHTKVKMSPAPQVSEVMKQPDQPVAVVPRPVHVRADHRPINNQIVLARQLLGNRGSLQQAFIVSEILSKPKGLPE